MTKTMFRLALAITFLFWTSFSMACPPEPGSGVPNFGDVLSAKSTSMEFGEGDEQNKIAVFGAIENAAGVCFDSVELEVRFFNAKKELVDTVVEHLYGNVVPAQKEMPFRVMAYAAKNKSSYDSVLVKVIDAEPHFGKRVEKSMSNAVMDILLSWGPMALFILIWLLFIRRMTGKNSPQRRSLQFMEQQTATLEVQSRHLERIATALEKRDND